VAKAENYWSWIAVESRQLRPEGTLKFWKWKDIYCFFQFFKQACLFHGEFAWFVVEGFFTGWILVS